MKTNDFAGAQVKRDQLIFLIRVEIDKWYSVLEQRLYEKRASFNSWMDIGELALTGASALATHTDVKTIYSTLSGITKGTHLSIDKNWFQEKATESLINAMRTGRNTQLAAIINKMKDNPANKYTFEEAWGDLITYYQVGTIQGGLVTLAATSGEKVKASEKEVSDANKSRYPPLPSATRDILAENGKAVAKALALTPDQKRAVLMELKVDIPDSADDAKLTELMTLAIQEIPKKDEAYRKNFITAVGKQPDPPSTPQSPN